MSQLAAIAEEDVMEGLDIWYLKLFGIWGIINDFRTRGERNGAMRFNFALTLLINLPSILCQVVAPYVIQVDMEKATILSSQLVPCAHLLIRHVVFWSELAEQSKLYDLLRRDFLSSVPPHKRGKAAEVYEKISRRSNLLIKVLLTTTSAVFFLWACFPCYSVEYIIHGTGAAKTAGSGRYKNLGGWYPLPMAQSPYFEVIFAYELVVVAWVCLMAPVYLCAFLQPLVCLSAHFTVLGLHVSTLKLDNLNSKGRSKELYDVLQDHLKLISYANELRTLYNPLVTMTLGVAIYMQIVCIFQTLYGGVKDIAYVLRFFQTLAYVVFEVAVFCYGSSYLEAESSALQDAIYSSEWYNADPQFRRTAQMVMIGCRKGITLTAIKMYPVNLETMVEIFRFTYTAAALMSRMAE